mgnify:FL=1
MLKNLFKNLSQKHPSFFPIVILILISTTGVWYLFFSYYPSQEFLQAANNSVVLTTAARFVSPLDGKNARAKAETLSQVVGVMVDNHPDARPESGISKAKIVYEAPVEGGLTRYLAIFDSKQKVGEVGPVRSARSYFLDWLQEYGNALYMHSGGSPEALTAIKTRKIFDANEFFLGSYFKRDKDRQAPHNLYTNSDNWRKIILSPPARGGVRGGGSGQSADLFAASKAWKYAKLAGKTIGGKGELKIPYGPDNMVTWVYDAKKLDYARFVNGNKEIDKDGTEVRARNILVQITSVKEINGDDKGRVEITTVGSGDAIILKKGSVVYSTWKKADAKSRTRFYDKNKKEVILSPGNTWVEIVSTETNVQVTN